jgi:hypothetical protein
MLCVAGGTLHRVRDMEIARQWANRYACVAAHVQWSSKKYFALPVGQIIFRSSRHPGLLQRALRDRHETLGMGCGGRGLAEGRMASRGRRKRVVLMPRRWHLAIMLAHYACGDNKARSPGRARHRPLKPFACGNAGMSWRTRGDLLACFFHLHARLRVRFAPGIPHALFVRGGKFFVSTRM